ncbi:hypothetical protein U8C36_15860 [Sinorhizobium medicae]|uniref:hypothetical protein n=1 Tax=Sinorhizobium medicae TaxID=110321 RepID=UPI002AF6B093|nr:hypothetical protein [Sinorhizobium medicae]WQO51395.1 hypothetical protein U8C36_15860 [Sinorhizobium medicae]
MRLKPDDALGPFEFLIEERVAVDRDQVPCSRLPTFTKEAQERAAGFDASDAELVDQVIVWLALEPTLRTRD